eukprot:TRINITY_DN8345_c0_g1_i7.p1 TRINITY_DN8345_c0_g1~~TRINITY_DN8345_c0_g1_i7.p1  ORF type:complete len:195 (-),score=35.99 TRINITY_DN8345_c0_g1_i7:93-677(-)
MCIRDRHSDGFEEIFMWRRLFYPEVEFSVSNYDSLEKIGIISLSQQYALGFQICLYAKTSERRQAKWISPYDKDAAEKFLVQTYQNFVVSSFIKNKKAAQQKVNFDSNSNILVETNNLEAFTGYILSIPKEEQGWSSFRYELRKSDTINDIPALPDKVKIILEKQYRGVSLKRFLGCANSRNFRRNKRRLFKSL